MSLSLKTLFWNKFLYITQELGSYNSEYLFLIVLKVTVEILDINDNSPRFRETQIYVPIVEAALVGSVYILPTASDDDCPAYGIQRYELDSTSTKFGLLSKTSATVLNAFTKI